MPHADEQIRKRLRSILVVVHNKNAAGSRCHNAHVARPMPVRQTQSSS
jgi:hypothetical protein